MVMAQLEDLLMQPSKKSTETYKFLHEIAEKINRRSLVFLFTDMFQTNRSEKELFEALRHLKHNKHEVVLFHTYDGKLELNMYPLSNGSSGVAPGNFGTVDIGSSNNSTADLKRQILVGVSAEDLAYFGGSLKLGPDGTLLMNGDTGISAGIKEELEEIKGDPRVIMLYSTVTANGNNAMYTIVGFVGVRIMFVNLTGSMSQKKVIIQPAVVVETGAIVSTSPNDSQYVYSNARLVR